MIIEIQRTLYAETHTEGHLLIDGKKVMYTLELPWLENLTGRSCIPEGHYPMKYEDHVYGQVYRIYKVYGRSGILIHSGNTTADTRGCVLVGLKKKDINNDGVLDVVQSRKAMAKLSKIIGGGLHHIFITSKTGYNV